jgi:hypothetical protein
VRTVRASEIGEYVYCRRAWWLRHVQGHASANVRQLAAGAAAHARQGRLSGLAALLRGAAVLAGLAALLSWLLSLLSAG